MGKKKKKKKSKSEDQESFDEISYSFYRQERTMLIKDQGTQADAYDKYLLTLSGGTFSLTVTFMDKVLQTIDPSTKWMIGLAWGLLSLTILLTLCSFLLSVKAYDRQIEILDNEQRGDHDNGNNSWSNITGCFNTISGVSFVLGIVFLFVFVLINL